MRKPGEALPIYKPEWWTPPAIADSGLAFQIKALPGIALVDVDMRLTPDGSTKFSGESCRVILAAGLLGWRGLNDEAGEPVEWDPRNMDANIERLDIGLVGALSVEIWIRSRLSEDERKNFESLQTSQQRETSLTATGADGAGTVTNETPRRLQSSG